nr:unnamed protein product [Spirometra erinaceieuropaei]
MTTQEVGQTIAAVPGEASHVQLLRDVSAVTEKQRAMSSVAAPRAAYSTLILGGDLAFKEGANEPPHGFPKRPRRLTGDFQSGFPRRPSATQGHLAASFMFGFAAADGSGPALYTGGRADQFGAPRKLRSSLQTFLPAGGLSQSRLPPLTVEKTGSPLTDSLYVSGQLQVMPVAIPSVTENFPETSLAEGGAAIERAREDLPEQTAKDAPFNECSRKAVCSEDFLEAHYLVHFGDCVLQ